jgi:hypothetical protein
MRRWSRACFSRGCRTAGVGCIGAVLEAIGPSREPQILQNPSLQGLAAGFCCRRRDFTCGRLQPIACSLSDGWCRLRGVTRSGELVASNTPTILHLREWRPNATAIAASNYDFSRRAIGGHRSPHRFRDGAGWPFDRNGTRMDFQPSCSHTAAMNAILFDTLRLSRTLRDKGHFTPEQA